MLYWLILARAFNPDSYGFVQYTITLATLVAILAQPIGQHVFARYIGKYRQEPEVRPALLTNLLAVLGAVFTASLIIAVPILAFFGELNLGVLVVFAGISLFYAYWGLANGMLYAGRLTLAYLASNLLQLAATFALINLLGIQSPLLALLIYGCSYLPALALLQRFLPLPLAFHPALIARETIKDILNFSWPVWISHIAYTVGAALPILLLNYFIDKAAVGVFSLALTLSALFGVVSIGLSTQLMPTIAGAPRHKHLALLKQTLLLLLVISALMLLIYLPLVRFVVPLVFGAEYLTSLATYGLLTAVAIANCVNGLLAAVQIGGGHVRIEAGSRIVNLAVTAGLGWLLVPQIGVEGAAAALLAGVIAAILINTYVVRRRVKSRNETA
ncbi:MAG: oligosaccharide flippase family protein [Oscillochloris sp.]|nr:oligosaccharide flippase family protein [Oscillochloris sp.]